MKRGAWRATIHGITKSWTRLSNFTFTFTSIQGSEAGKQIHTVSASLDPFIKSQWPQSVFSVLTIVSFMTWSLSL